MTPRLSHFQIFLHRFVNAIAISLIFLTCLTFAARNFWLADILANLRIQLIIAITVCVVLASLNKQKLSIAGLVTCIAIHGLFLWPARTAASAGVPTIRVSTINVHTSNREIDKILTEVRHLNPDVVAIVELSSELESAWNNSELSQTYPYKLTSARDDGNFGIGLFSKWPANLRQEDFSEIGLPSIVASIQFNGQVIHVVATHTLPPMGTQPSSIRNTHLHKLANHVQQQMNNHADPKIVVMGDLNITPWSPVFAEFLTKAELSRSYSGIQPTWYGGPSFACGLQLDHILVTANLLASSTNIGDDIGSDHRSVTVDLEFSE